MGAGLLLARVTTSPAVATVGAGLATFVIIERFLAAAGLIRGLLPENRRLIPQTTLLRHGARGVVFFGFQMGLGWKAYLPVAGPYLIAMFLVVHPSPATLAGCIALGFGFGRALPLLVAAMTSDLAARRDRLAMAERLSRPWLGLGFAIATAACLLASSLIA